MTNDSLPYFDPRTLAKLSGLHLRARHIVEGYVAGLHRSPYHGFSIEFAEHREYAPGDDLRHVDWKVYGRTDKFYLKQYEDETNLLCYLVLDGSESMRYRGRADMLSKFEYAQCVAASLAWLVLHQQDAAGLVTFNQEIEQFVRPGMGAGHWNQLVQAMERAKPEKKTAAGPIFHELAERFSKRGVVVILSDLFVEPNALLAGLKHFKHRRHDVVVMQVLDPAELDFPFNRPTLFRGLEEMPEVLTDPSGLRRAYLRELQTFLNGVERACRDLQFDYTLLRTDAPLDAALSTFLARRMARVG